MAGIYTAPQQDFGGELGNALAGAFNQSFQGGLERQYAEAQKQQNRKSLQSALTEAQAVYENKELSLPQKQIGLTRALANHPEQAKLLTEQLAKQDESLQKRNTDLAIEDKATQRALDVQRLKNEGKANLPPKEPKPTQASQPIKEQQLKAIQTVENTPEFKTASLPEKAKMLRDGLVSKENIDSLLENYKNEPSNKRDEILVQEQAKADSKYVTDLNERRSKQILKKESLGRLENMVKKGYKGSVVESFLDKIGLTAKTSEGRREFSAEAKNQFTDFKQIAGSQLSASEFFILSGAYPNADFSNEANEAIISNLKDVHDTIDKEWEIEERLIKENNGKTPERIQAKVNNELQGYVKNKVERIKANIEKIAQQDPNVKEYINEAYGIPRGNTLIYDLDGEALSVPDADVPKVQAQLEAMKKQRAAQ